MPGLPGQLDFCILKVSSIKASNKESFNIERPGSKTCTTPEFAKQVRAFLRPKARTTPETGSE